MNKIKKLIQEEINNLLLESYSKVLDDLFKAAKGAKKAEDLFSQLKNIDNILQKLSKDINKGRLVGGRKKIADAVAEAIADVQTQRREFERLYKAGMAGSADAAVKAKQSFTALKDSVKKLEQTNVGRIAARQGGDLAGAASLTRKGMLSQDAIATFTATLKQSGDRNKAVVDFANKITALGPNASAVQAIPGGNMVLSVAYLKRAEKAGVEGAADAAKRMEDLIIKAKGISADDLANSLKKADKILDAKKLIPTKKIKKFYQNLDKARKGATAAVKKAGGSAEEAAKVVKQVEEVAEAASQGRWAKVKGYLSKANNNKLLMSGFAAVAAYIGIGTYLSADGKSFDVTKPDPPTPAPDPKPGPSPTPKPKPRRNRNKIPLKRGSRGSKVKEVQEYLLALGFDLGPMGADGKFGKRTRAAVRDFQKREEIKVDGIVGKQTFARLKAHGGKVPTGKNFKNIQLPADYKDVKESKKSKLFNRLVENYTR